MILLVALTLASSQASIKVWANCIDAYALPRLKSEPTEKIVDRGMAACFREENAARDAMIRENGPVGSEMFKGVRYQAHNHLIVILNAAKRQRGYR
jgi:hypothetical protein